jgi:hypothetical protein
MTQSRQKKDKEIESSIENFLKKEKIYFIKPEKQSKKDGEKTPDFSLPNNKILIECKHHNSQSTEEKHSTLVKQIIEKIEKKHKI